MNGKPNWKWVGDVRTTGFCHHCAGIFSQNLSILRQIPQKTAMPSSFESFIEQKCCQPFFNFFFFLQRIASALQDRRFVWSGCGWLMPESVFVGFSFFFPCSTAHLDLVIFGTLMKRDGDKTWLLPVWRHCLCHWASRVFYLHSAKWLCEILLCRLLQNWQKSILLKMSGWEASRFHHLYFACYVFPPHLNERILVWISLSL